MNERRISDERISELSRADDYGGGEIALFAKDLRDARQRIAELEGAMREAVMDARCNSSGSMYIILKDKFLALRAALSPAPAASEAPPDLSVEGASAGDFNAAVQAELDHAYAKHGRDPWGRHEFYGVIKEEVDEVWDAIKDDEPTENMLKEVAQVAAMCRRYWETGDRYRGVHPLITRRPNVAAMLKGER